MNSRRVRSIRAMFLPRPSSRGEPMPTDPTDELHDVLAHYELGELVRHERDKRGTVNVSYSIETLKDGQRRKYFLRRYKSGIRREELLFEHSLVNHVANHSTCPVAKLHRTRNGSTFYWRADPDDVSPGHFYAIFDFLRGEDRYTWVGPRCTPYELRNAGALLAAYHTAVSTFEPEGMRAEKKILDLLEEIETVWAEAPAKSKGTAFDGFLIENFEAVRQSIAETRAWLDTPEVRSLPEIAIHSDYHPGNLLFDGEQISGLIDFDWSKIDLRAFDVALAAWYFCASWDGAEDGELRLADARMFISAYQQALLEGSAFPALSPDELAYLPPLINAGNIYILHWTLGDYFGYDVDPREYLTYLKHGITFVRWFDSPTNREELTSMLRGLPSS